MLNTIDINNFFIKKYEHLPIDTDESILCELPLNNTFIATFRQSYLKGKHEYLDILAIVYPEIFLHILSTIIRPTEYRKYIVYQNNVDEIDDEEKREKYNKLIQELGVLNSKRHTNITADNIQLLCDTMDPAYTVQFSLDESQKYDHILLCHGLSPVKEDSILLLCEIGRILRTSIALDKNVKVMLADASWMSYNLSQNQIIDLTNEQKEKNLKICLSNRLELYKFLDFDVDIKQIVDNKSVENITKDQILSSDLTEVSTLYHQLTIELYGTGISQIVEEERKDKKIDETDYIINQSFSNLATSTNSKITFPNIFKLLNKFPHPPLLKDIEEGLSNHLSLIKSVLKNWPTIDETRFTYFITQYFAQREYKGSVLKVAPVTESKFDTPFEKLTESFEYWISKNKFINSKTSQSHTETKLSVIYLPNYYLGQYSCLPYTPASGDIIRDFKQQSDIEKNTILLSEYSDLTHIDKILFRTRNEHRNRLLADLISFILLVSKRKDSNITTYINTICTNLGYPSFEDILKTISPKIQPQFLFEARLANNDKLREAWRSYIRKFDTDDRYIPLHLCFMLLDNSDWINSSKRTALCRIVRIGIALFNNIKLN